MINNCSKNTWFFIDGYEGNAYRFEGADLVTAPVLSGGGLAVESESLVEAEAFSDDEEYFNFYDLAKQVYAKENIL